MENVRKILLVSLSNLGDIILTTPVFVMLSENFPGSRIDVIAGPPGKSIFSAHPRSGRIIVRKRRQTIRERVEELIGIRKEKYDIIVDLKNSFLPFIGGARRGLPSISGRFRTGHMADVHLRAIKNLDIDVSAPPRFFIPVSLEEKEFVSGIMKGKNVAEGSTGKIVTINPGAKSHIKRWSIEQYAGITDLLEKELGCRVFIVGGEEDREIAGGILAISRGSSARDLTGKTSIGALYEMISRSDLVITNDSGPMHLASAAGTPTIALFGPSNEKKYGPLAPGSVVLAPEVDCRPCEKALCPKGFGDGCISRVSISRVFNEAKRMLGRI
ncbi:MAG: glycosyltransferase family 9 protein [Candidatus Omnitrophota bacterium]